MIFVTTGTITTPFLRLTEYMYDYAVKSGEKIFVQSGNCQEKKHPNIQYKSYLTFEEMRYHITSADRIVSAAGEGTLIEILQFSKHLAIFFPRLLRYKEHIDDQQLKTAETIRQRKLGLVAHNKEQLFDALSTKAKVNMYRDTFIKPNNYLIESLNSITSKTI